MDPLLIEYLDKVRATRVTAHLILLIDGQVLSGLPVSDHRFVRQTNPVIDELSEGSFESDDPNLSAETLKGLRFDPRDDDAEPKRYVTLDEARWLHARTDVVMPTMRIDLDAVTGWAVAPYEPPEDADQEDEAQAA